MIVTFILAVIAAVIVAYLLAMMEAALERVSRVASAEATQAGRRGAGALASIVADPPGYLSVLAFVRVVAEATAAVLITLIVSDFIEGTIKPLALAIAIMAVISFALVSVSPRTLGQQHTIKVALISAPVAVFLRRVLGPLAHLLVAATNAITPGRGFKEGPFTSEAEFRDLVDQAGESQLIEVDERAMIHSVVELGDTIAREVMVPRTDMITLDASKVCRQALNLFLRSGFSRIPVVGEGPDDVLGILYFRDVVRRISNGPAGADSDQTLITSVMRPATFVPDSLAADQLLRDLQRNQIHLAVVVDEYGGTAGLVTIEDVLEEIVGDITDEFDREGPGIEELPDGRWRIPAGMDIDDLADHFEVSIDEDTVDTVGGLIGKSIGQVPIVGSSCQVAGLELTAERMSGRRHRIATVLVTRLAQPDEGEDDPVDAPTNKER